MKTLEREFVGNSMKFQKKNIRYLLYPARCPFCDSVRLTSLFFSTEPVCPECGKKPEYVKEPVCKKCGKPIRNEREEYCYDCRKHTRVCQQGKALWVYEGEVKASIYRFKYRNRKEYGVYYGQEIARVYGTWIKACKIDGIVPIPLHKSRMRRRGYNQAEIVAREIGRQMELPVYPDMLVRIRNTKAQKTLSEAERKNNLKRAFKIGQNKVQLKQILVIDDIYTTGSTVNEAAIELRKTGAESIYYISVSIGRGY